MRGDVTHRKELACEFKVPNKVDMDLDLSRHYKNLWRFVEKETNTKDNPVIYHILIVPIVTHLLLGGYWCVKTCEFTQGRRVKE